MAKTFVSFIYYIEDQLHQIVLSQQRAPLAEGGENCFFFPMTAIFNIRLQ